MKDRERGGGDGVRVRKWRRGGEGESEVYIKFIHIRFHPHLGVLRTRAVPSLRGGGLRRGCGTHSLSAEDQIITASDTKRNARQGKAGPAGRIKPKAAQQEANSKRRGVPWHGAGGQRLRGLILGRLAAGQMR
jgi:hypothetical protein